MGVDFRIRTAEVPKIYGRTTPGALKSVVLRAGTNPVVRWTMTDDRGGPADLTPLLVVPDGQDPPGFVPVFLRMIENTILGFDPDFVAVCTDPAAGVVECSLDLKEVGGPGIYIAEFAVLAPDLETVVLSNQFTVLVERGLFGGDPTGIPTLAEIRMRLRDSPQHNELLGDYAWSVPEIVQSLQEPIDFWNAELPDIGVYYTTQNFPPQYRHWWIRGTIAALYRMASEGQRRNQFDYSAGGVQVQDSARSQEYAQAAQMEWDAFAAWVRSRKVFMNNELCWGTSRGY
jgi:hypothetical protein